MATDSQQLPIATHLALAAKQLKAVSDNPRLDAELLLCHVLDWPRTALYTRSEYVLDREHLEDFQTLLGQRSLGMPIAYLVKQQEFWSLPLKVSESVLIPRPDTELLVETTLALVKQHDASVLELGTGSGAISLALATEQPGLLLTACDISASALSIATQNAVNLQVNSITFIESDWFDKIPNRRFNFILSNPPYIRENDPHLSNTGIKFEPRIALVSGVDGLNAIRHIAHNARRYLEPGGSLLLEHGYDQGPGVCTVFTDCGYTEIATLKDAAGHDRVTHGQYNDEQ